MTGDGRGKTDWGDDVPAGATIVSLPRRCDPEAVRVLLPQLRDLVRTGPLAIDGVGVERIGLAGLQLLASARLSAAAAGTPLAVIASPALRAAAATAGLERLLFGGAPHP